MFKSVLFLLLATAIAVNASSPLDNGFFEGRSGEMVVTQSTSPGYDQDGSFMILETASSSSFSSSEIADTSVSPLVSHLIGLPHAASDDSSSFPSSSLFDKPAANFLLVIDGVSSSMLNDAITSTKSVISPAQNSASVLRRSSYPHNSLATVTTLLTGELPSKHGIVGSSWRNLDGEEVSAFSPSAKPFAATLSQSMSTTFGEHSLVLGASFDAQYAAALASSGKRDVTISFNHEQASFSIAEASSEEKEIASLEISASDVLSSVADGVVEGVKFDLSAGSSAPAFAFFAEVSFLRSLPNALANTQPASRRAPDFISFVSVGLGRIISTYGASSAEATAAARHFDAVLSDALSSLKKVYHGKLSHQIIGLAAANSPLTDDVIKAVSPYVVDGSENLLPQVYISHDILLSNDAQASCDLIQNAFTEACSTPCAYELHCMHTDSHASDKAEYIQHRDFLRMVAAASATPTPAPNGSTTTTYTAYEVINFQMQAFVGLLIAILAIVSAYAIYGMDVGGDTMIYGGAGGGDRPHQA